MEGDTEPQRTRFSEEEYYFSDNISEEEDGLSNVELNEESAASSALGLDELTDGLCYNGKKYEDLQLSDLKGILFQSIEEVEKFYAYYSIAKGFSVRKRSWNKNPYGVITRRELVCAKEGTRDDPPPKKKKKVHVKANREGNRNSQVNNEEQAGEKRRIKKGTGTFLSVKQVGWQTYNFSSVLNTCRAYELLVHQAGGFEYVGFTVKDLYNKLDGERREVLIDGDAQAAISFMNLKASRDPHFFSYFCVDAEGLANLFWRDSNCLTNYNNFGDVLIMDSTYKTNIYGQPLVVFVGVSSHRATVLFDCALLVDETEETYKWVVATFLSSMYGKKPISVITDQDDAMRNAIICHIPEATHRLCAWHISKNVIGKIHDVNIQNDFLHLIYSGLSVDEWERFWGFMVTMHNLEDNPWVSRMYNKRHRWAEAFFRDKFFGGVCSTQRCEGIHRVLKIGLASYMWLYEILPRLDKSMDRIMERCLYDDFTSINTSISRILIWKDYSSTIFPLSMAAPLSPCCNGGIFFLAKVRKILRVVDTSFASAFTELWRIVTFVGNKRINL